MKNQLLCIAVILCSGIFGSAFAKDHGTVKMDKNNATVIHRINCELKGVKLMTMTKEDCAKIEGVWIEEPKLK